jgi:hypothetical protein
MDRVDFYTGQLVTQQDLDLPFDYVETALDLIMPSLGLKGVVTGGEVTEVSPPNMKVTVQPVIAYNLDGQRLVAAVTDNQFDIDFDRDGADVDIQTPGYARWLSVIVTPGRSNTDLRQDINGNNVYFKRLEASAIQLVISAEAGTPSRPTVPAESILLADIYYEFGQTVILDSDINYDRVERPFVIETSGANTVAGAWGYINDALQALGDAINGYVSTGSAGVTHEVGGTWADGTQPAATNVRDVVHEIVNTLGAKTLSNEGARHIGAAEDTTGGITLAAQRLDERLVALRDADNLIYDGSASGFGGATLAAGSVEAALDALWARFGVADAWKNIGCEAYGPYSAQSLKDVFLALFSQGTPDGASGIGMRAVTSSPNSLVAGTVREQIIALLGMINADETDLTNFVALLAGTTVSNDGAKQIGAQASGALLAGTVRTQLDALDTAVTGLGTTKANLAGAAFSGNVSLGASANVVFSPARSVTRASRMSVAIPVTATSQWTLSLGGRAAQSGGTGTSRVHVDLDVATGDTLSGVRVYLQGGGGHVGLPATMPNARLWYDDITTGTQNILGVLTSDSSGSVGTYEGVHYIEISGVSEVVSANRRYFVDVSGESGANAITGLTVLGAAPIMSVAGLPAGG